MHEHQPTPSTRQTRRRRALTLAAGLLVPLAAVGGAVASSYAGAPEEVREVRFPPDTIVHVEGDAANGFGIKMLDGSWLFPPTDSEAVAECNEYDRRVQRVRCRVEVRTWYRDLANMQDTIAYWRAKRA